jgi:tetratricopeptide (TPR) repeat protein
MTRFALALLLVSAAPVARAQDDDWTPPPPRLIDVEPVKKDTKKTEDGAKQGADAEKPTPPYVGLLIGLGIGLAVFAVYKFLVEPRRKRRFLVAALELIARDDRAQLPDAERMLADALTQGLSRRDVATARFHLAYVRAQLGRFGEAAAVLADIPDKDRTREVVYLDLYLQSKLNAHDRVEAIYRDNGPLLGDMHDTKLIVGITYLDRARTFWAAKQMGGAVDYFNKLRKLGVLLDEIPEHIDDHQVVLGVAALFEKNPEQAEKHFRGAVEAAAAAGKPSIPGRLGLLLCTWTRDETPDVEEGLTTVANELSVATPTEGALATANCAHQGCRHEFRVSARLAGQRVTCTACRRGFRLPTELKPAPAATGDAAPDRLFGDDELLLTNVLLWRAVSLLYRWRSLPPNSGLPPEEQTEFTARLARVRSADPDLPDPDLLEGLVRYYFAAPDDDEERKAAVALLEKAIENGVNVPEVIDLANRERRVAEHLKHGLERFFAHVHTYIGDGSVPEEYREDMRARLNRSSRFKPPVEAAPSDAADAPSLSELQARSQVLRDRVYRVHKQLIDSDPNGTDAREISSLVGDLEKNTQELLDTASKVQRVEHDLMASTSEFLLKEEEQK